MPYSSTADLPAAVQKLPAKKQRMWMHIFNSAYQKCQDDGGKDCESSAFAQANGVVKKSVEDAPNYRETGEPVMSCPSCEYAENTFCKMYMFVYDPLYVCDAWMPDEDIFFSNGVHPEPGRRAEPMDEWGKAGARHSRTDAGMVQTIHDHSVKLGAMCGEGKAADEGFLVTGEGGDHLPTKRNGKIDHRLLGAAWAALHGGYRGNKYEGPGKQEAIAKLKKLYEQEGLTPPAAKAAEDNSLKAISETDTELRVGNYLALFGGRDLEGIASNRKNQDGTTGEYFSKATDFHSTYTDTGMLYVDFEHGNSDLHQDEVLGYVDWKSAHIDDRGLFVERVLNRRNKYVEWLKPLIEQGLIGTSSEPVQSRISKAPDGHILRWPLKRDTLTVSPMEPRMLSENTLSALKALAAEIDIVKSACLEAGILGHQSTAAEMEIQAKLAYIKSVEV